MQLRCVLLVLASMVCPGLAETNLYCGDHDCYSVLGLTRDATKRDIKKAYRKMALKWHPDKNKGDKKAAEVFMALSSANEVLSDDESRKNYDYYVDHPDERWKNEMNAFRFHYQPKTDFKKVLLAFFAALSALQFFVQKRRHEQALKFFRRKPDLVNKATQEAYSRALAAAPPQQKGRRKEEIRVSQSEIEAVLDELMETVEISGGYCKPEMKNMILPQVLWLPIRIALYFWWYGRWVLLFGIMGQEYGQEEAEYKTWTALYEAQAGRWNQDKWDDLKRKTPEKAQLMVDAQLWIAKNMAAYTKEQEEEFRRANPNQWKRMQRWKKNR